MQLRLSVLVLLALALTLPGLAPAASQTATPTSVSGKLADTKAALRDLWIGHVFWVRNVVDARFGGDAAEAEVAQAQVVANAHSIAAAIEPFYGEAASKELFVLLAGHWGAISEYLDSTRAANEADQEAAYQKLIANAGEIAEFLGGANPYLPVATLRSLLTAHGAHHVQQIEQFQLGQYEEEAKTWAAMKDHMYVIADALAGGIAQQFPERFL